MAQRNFSSLVRERGGFLSRRECLRRGIAGVGMASLSGWMPRMAQLARSAEPAPKHRACILLWMPGGPSQLDTFDPKPGHANAGAFKAIETAVPGIQICEHLPQLAQSMQHLALIRSMKTKEGDHGRATYHLHTGYRPAGPIEYPAMGSFLSHELGQDDAPIPNYVSILPQTFLSPKAFGSGFLGPRRAPLVVGDSGRRPRPGAPMPNAEEGFGPPLEVRNLGDKQLVRSAWQTERLSLLEELETGFAADYPGAAADSHRTAVQQAVRLMQSDARRAFELEEEPVKVRESYGKNRFGQGCLLARRLVERGVAFVEVALTGDTGGGISWDTHADNFNQLKPLLSNLDQGWSALIRDLQDRNLLSTTLIVWMGEFGRTPTINAQTGRDHFPQAWSTVLCGGGIKGGQAYGRTNASGDEVTDNPVPVNNLLATVCHALGIDHAKQNPSNVGRPIRLVEPTADPISDLLG